MLAARVCAGRRRPPVALCVIVTLEHLEWRRPEGSYISPTLSGGYGNRPHPDVTRWSHREYGHRVGVFRIFEVLQRHGIKPTVAMDALTARHYPFLVKHCLDLGAEIIGHGISVSRMITSGMDEGEERAYIAESLEALTEAAGQTAQGVVESRSTANRGARPNCSRRRASGTCATGSTTSSPTGCTCPRASSTRCR